MRGIVFNECSASVRLLYVCVRERMRGGGVCVCVCVRDEWIPGSQRVGIPAMEGHKCGTIAIPFTAFFFFFLNGALCHSRE